MTFAVKGERARAAEQRGYCTLALDLLKPWGGQQPRVTAQACRRSDEDTVAGREGFLGVLCSEEAGDRT